MVNFCEQSLANNGFQGIISAVGGQNFNASLGIEVRIKIHIFANQISVFRTI